MFLPKACIPIQDYNRIEHRFELVSIRTFEID